MWELARFNPKLLLYWKPIDFITSLSLYSYMMCIQPRPSYAKIPLICKVCHLRFMLPLGFLWYLWKDLDVLIVGNERGGIFSMHGWYWTVATGRHPDQYSTSRHRLNQWWFHKFQCHGWLYGFHCSKWPNNFLCTFCISWRITCNVWLQQMTCLKSG